MCTHVYYEQQQSGGVKQKHFTISRECQPPLVTLTPSTRQSFARSARTRQSLCCAFSFQSALANPCSRAANVKRNKCVSSSATGSDL